MVQGEIPLASNKSQRLAVAIEVPGNREQRRLFTLNRCQGVLCQPGRALGLTQRQTKPVHLFPTRPAERLQLQNGWSAEAAGENRSSMPAILPARFGLCNLSPGFSGILEASLETAGRPTPPRRRPIPHAGWEKPPVCPAFYTVEIRYSPNLPPLRRTLYFQ